MIQKDDVVWEGPVVPPGGRFVAQSDSLTIGGLCVMPPGHLAAYMRSKDPDGTLSHLKVAVVWAAAANGSSLRRESKAKGTFMLYGPLDMASSMVRAVGNEADGGEVRVLREQSVRVSLLDKKGRNRVGGEDADLFFLDVSSGPSLQPQVCCSPSLLSALSLSVCVCVWLMLCDVRTNVTTQNCRRAWTEAWPSSSATRGAARTRTTRRAPTTSSP
jgi:hypothetical protein